MKQGASRLRYLSTAADAVAARAKADLNYGFNSVLKFFQVKREQIDRKETAIGTVRNYAKSIKLFCDMADLQIPRAKITRGLPREKRFADERAPTLQYLSNVALTADHGFIRFHRRNKGYWYQLFVRRARAETLGIKGKQDLKRSGGEASSNLFQ